MNWAQTRFSTARSLPTLYSGVRTTVTLAIALSAALLAWSAWRHSPTVLEVAQLPAGLVDITLGKFDLCLVNPPLVRTVAALPVWAVGSKANWRVYGTDPPRRAERALGSAFLKDNGPRSFWLFTLARWACIPFMVIGGYACAAWARELYGGAASVAATLLWCFSPYILGHGSLMTPDAPAAALAVLAGYSFWRWLRRPGLAWTVGAGAALGFAQLAKFTLIAMYPVGAASWLVYSLCGATRKDPRSWLRELGLLIGVVSLSLCVINLGYGFDGSFTRLGDFAFKSEVLRGANTTTSVGVSGANRFAGAWLEKVPIPVPKSYVLGIDLQRWDFERGRRSYLRGEWKSNGWWYFHLYALAVKTPLGTWALVLMAACLSVCAKRYSAHWRDELVLLLPPMAILALVSSQTGFSIHSRYVLPALPFVIVWISKAARAFELKSWKVALPAGVAIFLSVASSLAVYPHSLSYFNELVGGPGRGHEHLADSDISWGQDLLYLSRWLERHPEAQPLHLASFGPVDPRLAGIQFRLPSKGPDAYGPWTDTPGQRAGPLPGWFAIDVNHLAGAACFVPDGQGGRRLVAGNRLNFRYFRRFEPIASAGYSIYIYHITPEEANRVRQELGLPLLPVSTSDADSHNY